MKKLFLFLMLSLSCLMTNGQSREEAVSTLKSTIQMLNAYMPQPMGPITLERMEIAGQDCVIYVTLDESMLTIDDYINAFQLTKSSVASLAMGENEQFTALFKASQLNLVYFIKGNNSGREATVSFSADELNNTQDEEKALDDYIKQSIELMSLPMEWENGMTLTAVYLMDNNFCYEVKTDESIFTIGMLKMVKAEGSSMEEGMLEVLKSETDPISVMFIKYIIKGNLGIRYIFWSEDSHERIAFTLTSDMLKQALN